MPITVTRWVALLVLISACAKPSARGVEPPPPADISFLSIVVDKETLAADTRLKRHLEKVVAKSLKTASSQRGVRFPQQTMPYGEVIRAFVERDPGKAYLARITPYAYVAAEMLGAQLDILATYRSAATKQMTYRSYFVVPKETFNARLDRPAGGKAVTLEDLVTYLRTFKDEPARFIYHDRFSTSSYFLPSLYFRTHHIFSMSQSLNPELIPIRVDRAASTSSTQLVAQVANGTADLAAVWDGTRNKFEKAIAPDAKADQNDKVLFIQIDTLLPNDFLVASGLSDATKDAIVESTKDKNDAGSNCADDNRLPCPDDFVSWHAWDSNDSVVPDTAREALARLRQFARERPMPVVVKVEADKNAVVPREYVDAAKEAVRLSGTEFVLEDKDLHKRVDMTWTLELIHDGAIRLTSMLDPAFGPSADHFSISFADKNDLPKRIADLARSRLRRIRYVWPYEEKYPAVLRDLDFTPDHKVLVQKISWMDPTRNEYEQDTPFAARIENNTDFSKLRLSDEIKFSRSADVDGSFNFEPMSNVAYRVIIAREPHAGWIWVVLPYCFIGLFVAACAGLAIDLRRRQPPPQGLQQTYQRMVEAYHRPWRKQEIEEGEILWSDTRYMDELVKELKTAGSFLDVVGAGGFDFNFGPLPVRFSVLMKLASQLTTRRPQLSSALTEASGAGCVASLDTLIQFLVRRRRLSSFVGFPEPGDLRSSRRGCLLEWDALNDIASRHFRRLGIGQKQLDAGLSAQSGVLSTVVSSHFRGVIKKGTHDASLFRQTWRLGEKGTPDRLVCEGALHGALQLRGESGAASKFRVEVILPPDALGSAGAQTELRAWVFGKIITWSVAQETLLLRVRPFAVLRDYAHQQ